MANIVNMSIIDQYEKLQIDLKRYVESTAITKVYIIKKAGFTRPYFDRHLKNRTFTVADLRKVAEVINGQRL